MASGVTIRRPATSEQVVLVSTLGESIRLTKEEEVASRFGLNVGEFQIFEESQGGVEIGAKSSGTGPEREWELKSRNSYTLCVLAVELDDQEKLPSNVAPTVEWGWSIPNVEDGDVTPADDDDNLCDTMDSETEGWSTPSNLKDRLRYVIRLTPSPVGEARPDIPPA
jgi:hypothetical protein